MKNFKIFAGTASQDLAKKVAKILGISLGKREVVRFADGECRVRIEEDVSEINTWVIQSLCPPVDENLLELCLLGDTLRRNGAAKIFVAIPYLGYVRQDKVHRKGECLSAQVVAKILEEVGFEKMVTVDVHSQNVLNFYKIPAISVSATPAFASKAKGDKNFMVMAPDEGAIKRARELAKLVGAEVGHLEKDRDLITGKIKVKKIYGNVARKTVVIVDDMISTGGTLVLAAEVLKKVGASKIIVCATHPLLVKEAVGILKKSPLEKIIVTDTIPVPKEKQFKKLEIVSVAPILAKVLQEQS